MLCIRAATLGAQPAFRFLSSGEEITSILSYADLDRQARAIAVALRQRCSPGDRALLLYPSGLEFISAFFGCLYAGVVAIPAYPPRPNESIHRLRAIVADAGAHVALTTRVLLQASAHVTPENLGDTTLPLLTTDDLADPAALAERWTRPTALVPDTLAFLQYTSGSTGQPKGVMLTHGQLLANQEMIRRLYRHDASDIIAGWLPLFHDMGLIGLAMQTLYVGATCLLMPPAAFLQKPLRWLQLLSRFRVTTTGGPNFAYELCARRVTPAERATLDLSSLRIAFNGSEPIHAATLNLFAATFAECGFHRDAFLPCYGMAEASLLVTGKTRGRPLVQARFDPAALAAGRAEPSTAPDARILASSGRVAPGLRVLIVDPVTGLPLRDGVIGEIWVRGPSIGSGYWNNPELSAATFGARLASSPRARARHLRTGDLGFLLDGELFVTGRLKDLIIVRGRNLYPQDLEATATAAHSSLRAHGTAAFAVADAHGAETVVLVLEVERTALRAFDAPTVAAAIRAALVREHEVAPAALVFVKPATMPKTSSGKIQRAECRRQFLAGELSTVERIDLPAPAPVAPSVSASSLQNWLTTRVAAALNVPATTLDLHAPLQTLGLDSLAAVTLSGELADHLARPISPTIVYDHPTIAQLAAHFSSPSLSLSVSPSLPPSLSPSSDSDAIAIIGQACRFPGGATDPEKFWQLLRAGTDTITDIPADRWDVDSFYDADPEKPGRMYVRRGSFLANVTDFDPEFFNISPREAAALDPQHRLLLELAWESLEHAAIAPTSLVGSATGVFVGVSLDDYARLAATSGDTAHLDAYSALGAARALASARLSYHLGLRGPSLVVDTLCSSSLLAVHLAARSLRSGECRLALAGGANLILAPDATIASCKLRALAPDGRCKTFDASANGYARGEGAGLVVLKRLADAFADGDPILAVLRGSATNHDGKSNGLTAPSGPAQQELLRSALDDAHAQPRDVAYVEAHGTGTVLGDPIEVKALGAAYGENRAPDSPLLLGAVKTNLGHLESAAGIAGLIKTVLALQHAELPATLHQSKPNPYIPWADLPLRVVTTPTPFASPTALAGVSSFGLGGTNVHVLLSAAPAPSSHALPVSPSPHLFLLSAPTIPAALANATAWADFLTTHPDLPLADLCHTAATGRTHFSHRAALLVSTHAELIAKLRALTPADVSSSPRPSISPSSFHSVSPTSSVSTPAPQPLTIAFLFTGQGSHYAGMARELYTAHPALRATIDECSALFADLLPQPLTTVLFAADDTLLSQTLYAQPALFAVELALGRLWLSWGVRPTGIFGHSIGEYAAACLAGVFSLADAARLVAAKARLTHALPPGGAMLAASASPEALAPHLATHPETEIAAFNGPSATTLAGPVSAIQQLLSALTAAGLTAQRLPISQAFHSRALDPILAEFAAIARTVTYHAPTIPLASCLHGQIGCSAHFDADYWVRQMREPVQFTRGLTALAHDLRCNAFIEIGPKPSLISLGQSVLPRAERPTDLWLPSLRPNRADWSVLLTTLAALHTRGATIDWTAFGQPFAPRRLSGLPTHQFQRRRHWLDLPRLTARPAALATPPDDISTFALRWVASPLTPFTGAPAPADWHLVCPDDTLAAALSNALTARAQRIHRVALSPSLTSSLAASRNVLAAALSALEIFQLAQRLVVSAPASRLWLVTENALATGRETSALTLDAAPLAGFARAFALEHPSHWGALVDSDSLTSSSASAVAAELLSSPEAPADDFIALRAGTRLVPRLAPHALPSSVAPIPHFAANRTYLITGGTGALGLALARWLIAHGARHLVLLSRHAPPPSTLSSLNATDATVRHFAADVTSHPDLTRVFTALESSTAPLAGVFHAAGLSGFTPLTALTAAEFSAVLAPKITGAQLLHAFTRALPLDHFVLFSSISSVWGSSGQTHYAAANAHLDTLAHERRRLGLPALSINWGPWDEAGMAASGRDQLRRIGLIPLAPAAALTLLGRLLTSASPQITAAAVNWSLLHPVLTLRRAQPLLDAFAPTTHAAPPTGAVSEILTRLRSADTTQRTDILATYLQQTLARILGRAPTDVIDPHQGFFALGMDSLMAVELRTHLESDLALRLPTTIAFDRANLAALHAELLILLFAPSVSAPPLLSLSPSHAHSASPPSPLSLSPSSPPHATAHAQAEPIAILALACRFPGGVSTPAEFWSLLRDARSGLAPVPPSRWDSAALYHPDPAHPGTLYTRDFGFIDGVDQFDHAFFNLYPREAAGMDPQQRLLLETAWQALESAGLATERLRGSDTGTFVGVSTNDYAQLVLKSGDPAHLDAYFGTGNALNAIAGRIAYALGLRGPTMITDTACSSSLVALHQACAALRAGECTTALAAGVNLLLTPEPAIALSRARMLSPDGRCKTFDASADGYGRGEGCGVLVLQRLSTAQASGAPILAVIPGSAVNQDGASSGFTVPSGTAQQELIARALAVAGRSPDDLDYIEAHGTGTPLGDPIELNALAAVVGHSRPRPLLVGSVKTNLGHLEAAAGIAGVIKTVLALRHSAIPAHLHFTRPSPHIPWSELPLTVPTQLTPWPDRPATARLAGVSAFGFTGTNAHVLLESYSAPPSPVAASASEWTTPASPTTHLIPLSARTPEALLAQRTHLLAYLDTLCSPASPHSSPPLAAPTLSDLAHTYAAGRTHFALREIYYAISLADLRAQLAARLSAPAPATPATATPLGWHSPDLTRLSPSEISTLYLAGHTLDWRALSTAGARHLTDTPTYPFQRRRHWLDRPATASPRLSASSSSAPHSDLRPPISHLPSPISALLGHRLALPGSAEIRFSAHYSAHAPAFLDHHRLFGRVIAPAAQHIALLLAAARTALRAETCTLTALSFPRALTFSADESRAVQLVLSPTVDAPTTTTARLLAAPVSSELSPASSEPDAEWTLHATATITATSAVSAPPFARTPTHGAAPLTHAEFYSVLDAAGYTLGPSFRWIASAQLAADGALGTLTSPTDTLERDTYDLHPGLLDSCFQLLGWSAGVQSAELAAGTAIYIPASIDAVRFYRRPSSPTLRCVVRLTERDHTRTHKLRGDLVLLDADGTPCLEVRGFEARRAPRSILLGETTPLPAPPFHQLTWTELPLSPSPLPSVAPSPSLAPTTWSLLGQSPLAVALGDRLRARGHRATHELAPSADATAVVLFLEETPSAADLTPAESTRLLTLVQTLAALARQPRLTLVTRGAQLVPGDYDSPALGASAALGLARIVALEHPELHLVLVDLDPTAPAGEDAALEHELFAAPAENQIALRGTRRLAARFTPAPAPSTPSASTRLTVATYGNLDTLALTPAPRRAPAPGEIEIEVRAAGLNFRDILNALGVLRAHLATLGVTSAADLPLGGECAGTVTAVGPHTATNLRIGDSVIAALATGSFATHVTVDARFAVAKPTALTFAEAATLPVAYLTAHHAFRELAQLRAGERVLIHAAAGGVGLAAVFLARHLGAEVCATASPAKWPLLRRLGVTILGHSRNTDYADTFAPVDVVLNSLTGDHIPRSLALLAPGGRFIEIGKLGIWPPEQIAAQRPDVAYHAFDLVELARTSPDLLASHLLTLSTYWSPSLPPSVSPSPSLPPLPLRAFPLADAASAFRVMAQAKHTGKLVLVRAPSEPPRPRRDGAYLITGGLGGLGLAIAGHLARTGAGTLVLVTRRAPTPAHAPALAALRAAGATVVCRATDLSHATAVTTLIASLTTELGPLRGVFHCAGILDDGLIAQQTPARLAAVFAPKAAAAWHLHLATRTQPLDYFILFSSLAAVLGSPGQSTYAAANAALDALAHHRQRLGLPALSINWGPWSGAGMAARLGERELARLIALGLTPFDEASGLTAFAALLARPEPQLAAAQLDVRALVSGFHGHIPPLLRSLASPGPSVSPSLLPSLSNTAPAARPALVVAALTARLTTALGLASGDTLAPDRSLTSLGFDSLMAVELKTWIAAEFSVEIPMQELAGLSLDALARAILTALNLSDTSAPALTAAPAIEDLLRADAILPDDIRPLGPVPALNAARSVLLTGATGFLGAFLLYELLTTTDVTVHCLVRADSPSDALARILENLRTYGLLPSISISPSRLIPIPGDLAQPLLGLTPSAFTALADSIDAIYHNGAWLNFFYAYAALKAANVTGTVEVLRLATRGTPKPVHYVSTSGVFYSRAYRGRALSETDAAEHCEGHALGYSQSKWVAERLVTAAGERGLPVTIHRAPFITGSTQTGAWNSDDFICRLVRGVIALGAMPDLSASMDLVPVDYVARAIATLSRDPASAGQRFHLAARAEVPWSALAPILADHGHTVRRLSYAEWLTLLPPLRGTDHPLAPFLALFLEKSGPDRPSVPEVFLQSIHSRLDNTATAHRLAALSLDTPALDAALWSTYLGALARAGLVPTPSASVSTTR